MEAAIQKSLPGSRLVEVKPNPRLVSIAEPVYLIGYQYALVTNDKVADDMVYRLAKAIHGNKADLVESHGVFRQFDPDKMAPKLDGASYHPGAIEFYKEAGIWQE